LAFSASAAAVLAASQPPLSFVPLSKVVRIGFGGPASWLIAAGNLPPVLL